MRIPLLSALVMAGCVAPVIAPPDADVPDAGVDTGVASDGDTGVVCRAPGPHGPRPVIRFERRQLDTAYRAEGVAVFDVDLDGAPDIVTDQEWRSGPLMTVVHPVSPRVNFDYAHFASAFGVYADDVDGDGDLDAVVVPHYVNGPAYWYENPRDASTHTVADINWARHQYAPVRTVGHAVPFLVDLFGDGGPPVLLSADTRGSVAPGTLVWRAPIAGALDVDWSIHPISGPAFEGAAENVHGLGVGDLDRDGHLDVISSYGWFRQNFASDRNAVTWTAHGFPRAIGDHCGGMASYLLDDDDLPDVICSEPHDRAAFTGLHWLQQVAAVPGADPTFVDHAADDFVAEMTALALVDLDADGVAEVVSGTRWCAHGCDPIHPADPELPYLVYYAIVGAGCSNVSFVRHVIDDASGTGAAIATADVDRDGRVDIVTAGMHGLFYFRQLP